jgi:hypothetical protein
MIMGLMHPIRRAGHRTGSPWPRRRRREWARRNDAVTLGQLLAAIPSLPRAELARLTEQLIDRMDEIDGDIDLEDDDPAGGSADDVGEEDETNREGVVMPLPRYGVDQSAGPINVAEANHQFKRDWHRHVFGPRRETPHE